MEELEKYEKYEDYLDAQVKEEDTRLKLFKLCLFLFKSFSTIMIFSFAHCTVIDNKCQFIIHPTGGLPFTQNKSYYLKY